MGRDLECMLRKIQVKPDITVIIPCYNSGFNIVRTLHSLKSQTYKNFKIIIINDGSTDEVTKKILKNINEVNVKIINQKNKGLSIARNTGILNSKTEFILPLDSDDWISSTTLENFKTFLQKNKNYSFVYSNIVNQNQSVAILKKNFNFFEQLFSNQIPYCSLIRKSVFDKVGLYDEKMKKGFEDWEMNIRLGKYGLVGFCLNKNLFYYNVSDEGMLKSLSLKSFSEIYSYIRFKHKVLYSFSNLLSCYLKNYNKKSSHPLILYFFYNLIYHITSSKVFNAILTYFIKNFSITSKLDKTNKKGLINKNYKVKKIAHIITSLNVGGAETALVSLLKELKINKKNFIPSVIICLSDEGHFYKEIISLGAKVYCLKMRPNKLNLSKQLKLYKILKKEKPDIVQTWMYHSDLVGSLASYFANIKTIIWTVHNFNTTIKALGIQTKIVVTLCSVMSHIFPTKIISVSKSAIKNHLKIGYNKNKFTHIPLGYNKANIILGGVKLKDSHMSSRKNIDSNEIIFGSLSRWNIQKNHKFMLESFGLFKKKNKKKFKLLLGGKGMNNRNIELLDMIKKNNLKKEVVLLDWISDANLFFSKIDVHILTSIGEAFPNVVCEAMLNKVPCISSNVGDVANILGSTGWMFEVNNYKNLDNILMDIFTEIKNPNLWKIRKDLARKRIVENFGLDLMLQNYYQVWSGSPLLKKGYVK